jgi:hypothetical protein
MPRPRRRIPATKFLVSLPAPLAIELEAFCRAHFDAPRMEVIRRALKSYLGTQLSRDPSLRQDFLAYKRELAQEANAPLRLVSESEPTKR